MSRKIETLDLNKRVMRKLTRDGVLVTVDQLYILQPWILAHQYRLSDEDWAHITGVLRRAGERPLEPLVRPEAKIREPKGPKPCAVSLDDDEPCGRPKMLSKQTCEWHWLTKQSIAVQIVAADQRRAAVEAKLDFEFRSRVSSKEWPEGERWCSECQGFVPLWYVLSSKCYAHGSRAAHASMVERVYQLSRHEYDALLAWQKGRCYICQQVPRAKRLAVDHDHVTNEVRGLLCANDEWGCNVTLRRLLNDVNMARRALAYVEKSPLRRLRDAEPPVEVAARRPRPQDVTVAASKPLAAPPDSKWADFLAD